MRRIFVNRIFLLSLAMSWAFVWGAAWWTYRLSVKAQSKAEPQEPILSPSLTGDFRKLSKFRSRFLKHDRDALIYLPPGYETDKKRRYPVLYLHDGQNLFDGSTAFVKGREWRVDETAQKLIESGAIEPIIIVGVYNTGDRTDEYTPDADPKYKVGGLADRYGRMLTEELKPFIDANYRTLPDAAHTGLGGSSLGGLVTLYLAMRYPNTFGRIAVMSPSVWWSNRHILKAVNGLPHKLPFRVWLDMGTSEGGDEAATHLDNARDLRDELLGKGWKLGSELYYFEAAGAGHNEEAWADRMDLILRFLFPRQ
jgi:predicted alpha/beta superfamily hydrolase